MKLHDEKQLSFLMLLYLILLLIYLQITVLYTILNANLHTNWQVEYLFKVHLYHLGH